MKSLIMVSALICAICGITFSQTPVTLKAAIDTALKNNLLVKNEQLKATYQEMLIQSAAVIPKANVYGDIGQINSIYTDTKFGISQSFLFPKVYTKQKELVQQEWKASLLNVSVKEALLKNQVARVYIMLVYVKQKRLLLEYSDSLYTSFYKRAELRLAKGESNVLEKASAEAQLGQIHIQLSQLSQDYAMLLLQFQILLNSTISYVPDDNENKMIFMSAAGSQMPLMPDTASLKEHPGIKIFQQQQLISDATVQLEKSRLLPDISVGYSNSSIQGTGADNKTYSASRRFNAVQVGVGIPIFAKAQKAKISSATFGRQIADNEYTLGLKTMQSEYRVAWAQYKKQAETVQYFESAALKNAQLIITTANQQLFNGNINYLEWVQLVNQATAIKNDYTEAVKNLNESIIQLNYFTNQ